MAAEGPAEALNQTVNTQPLMLVAGVACWRAWQDEGRADAGVFRGPQPRRIHARSWPRARCASRTRCRWCAFAPRRCRRRCPKAPAASPRSSASTTRGCRRCCADAAQGEVVEAANLNSPGQVVIAGHRAAVERAMQLAKDAGAKRAVMLPMSAPSHCSLMRPAAERLRERLAAHRHRRAARPGGPQPLRRGLRRSASASARRWCEQLDHPVRWIETVEFLAARGVKRIVECGPGKVLAGSRGASPKASSALAIQDDGRARRGTSGGTTHADRTGGNRYRGLARNRRGNPLASWRNRAPR